MFALSQENKAALRTSNISRLRFARAADFWATVLALPLFAAAGWPLLGWLAGALVWLGQRIVQVLLRQKIARTQEPRKIVGLIAGSTMIRAWGAAIAVLVVGLIGDEEVGLSAALMVVGLFTVYFATLLMQRLMAGEDLKPGGESR